MMYANKGIKHTAVIGGVKMHFDSKLEARVALWLHEHGHTFIKPQKGISYWWWRYTPDFWLSVQYGGLTHNAIVEVKPTLEHFTGYVSLRMRRAGKKFSKLLLLYTDKEKTWYRIDIKSGELEEFGAPVPGEIPMEKLAKTRVVKANSIYAHQYEKPKEPGKRAIEKTLDALIYIIRAPFGVPGKSKRRRTYRRRK